MPAQPLSPSQLAEAAKLKALFQEWQRKQKADGLPFSQEAAAEILGFGQSAVAQYLNGKIPLNVDVGIKFSKLLGVPISDFGPSLVEQATKLAGTLRANGADLVMVDRISQTVTFGEVKYGSGLPVQLQAQVVLGNLSEREAALVHKFRMATEKSKTHLETMADGVLKQELAIVHDKAQAK